MYDTRTKNVRAAITKDNGSELYALIDETGLKEIWNKKQALIAKMHEAIDEAVAKAKEPFIEELAEIDIEYATLLNFIGNNSDE